jgi:hypothetical protein
VSSSVRTAVAARAGGCCEYCRSQDRFAVQSFAVEHVEPQSGGGSDDAGNLAYSCQGCNNHKYTRTRAVDPATGTDVPLFHPRRQVWSDHFSWGADCTEVLGLTPTGRATVVALRLNRPGVANLRSVLFSVGLHPPEQPADAGRSPRSPPPATTS